ncbi:hypothetical protein HYC85_029437 [Camellia sinensis]|uniref:Uncharacterized protein n=1 Tax=Camellia sinensis TaxID=4442 RepID=A0A7J7G206_CAMSI|nr:hypothetical protein HYC85_029437 [Camellia sinensis]
MVKVYGMSQVSGSKPLSNIIEFIFGQVQSVPRVNHVSKPTMSTSQSALMEYSTCGQNIPCLDRIFTEKVILGYF